MPAPVLIGHERVAESLWRMASEERLPQTLLFAGPEGVGRATLARHLAAGINCTAGPGKPCGDCHSCDLILATDLSAPEFRAQIEERRRLPAAKRAEAPLVIAKHPDVLTFPPDGPVQVIGIEQARMLRNAARLSPAQGRRRVFIIDRAERASPEAANALLKTLEEPAENLTIILTSENPYLLPSTIRSRSIPFYLAPLSREQMQEFLQSREDVEESVKERIAAWSQGSPGIALSIDVEEFLRRRRAMLALVRTAQSGGEFAQLAGEMEALARKQSEGIDRLAAMLATLLRDILRLHVDPGAELIHRDIREDLAGFSQHADFAWAERAMASLEELEHLHRANTNIQKQIAFEAFALSMQPAS